MAIHYNDNRFKQRCQVFGTCSIFQFMPVLLASLPLVTADGALPLGAKALLLQVQFPLYLTQDLIIDLALVS
jgi:hypothetical protein